jgi:zinc transporter ZupT/pimeloyl-ACP methyl ester carboxylesterase
LLLLMIEGANLARSGSPVGAALTGGCIAALATALGTVPVLLSQQFSQRAYDSMLGFGAGVMLAASSFSLVIPALAAAKSQGAGAWGSGALVGAGVLLGAMALLLIDRVVPHEHFVKGLEGPESRALKRVWLFVLAIVLHNLPEGLAIGVAFAGTDAVGATALTTGISIQDVPEGLVVALALRSVGYGKLTAVGLGVLSGWSSRSRPCSARRSSGSPPRCCPGASRWPRARCCSSSATRSFPSRTARATRPMRPRADARLRAHDGPGHRLGMNPMDRHADAPDPRTNGDVALHVATAGADDAPLVILLHGFPEYWGAWRQQVQPLVDAGWRVACPTSAATADRTSPTAPPAYTLDTLADDVMGIARALGAPRFSLVGHDWGGMVAWHLRRARGAAVERLAILNAPHPATFFSLRAHASAADAAQHLRRLLPAARGFPKLCCAPTTSRCCRPRSRNRAGRHLRRRQARRLPRRLGRARCAARHARLVPRDAAGAAARREDRGAGAHRLGRCRFRAGARASPRPRCATAATATSCDCRRPRTGCTTKSLTK